MINIICEYIKYQLIAKRRHRVHSPFVYDFGDTCLKLPIPKHEYSTFKNLKIAFLKDKSLIKVNDMGAGSKKLNQFRSIQRIAKVSGSSDKYGKLLFRIVSHYQIKNALELGTSLGLGTYMLAAGNEEIKITTIEGCENTFAVAKKHFPEAQRHKVTFINDSFVGYLKSRKDKTPFDLVFIDGDHQGKSLFEQLRLLEPFIHNETLIILDDIRWSKDMLNAWKKLTNDPNYHLSIDLFRIGIIAKRTHQQKEHFVVRY